MTTAEYDEFGAGRAENAHARLYADLMADLRPDRLAEADTVQNGLAASGC